MTDAEAQFRNWRVFIDYGIVVLCAGLDLSPESAKRLARGLVVQSRRAGVRTDVDVRVAAM